MAYVKLVINDASTLNVDGYINSIQDALHTKEVISIKLLNYKATVNNFITDITITKTLQDIEAESEEITLFLVDINIILNYVKTVLAGEENANFNALVSLYNNTISLLTEVKSEFTPDETKEQYILDVYNNMDIIFEKTVVLCNEILIKNEGDFSSSLFNTEGNSLVNSVMSSMPSVVVTAIETYNDNCVSTSLKNEMIQLAKDNASAQQTTLNNAKSTTFTTQLQNFTTPIQFANGSDGDLTVSNPDRTKVLENLLIKGYKGLIDESITNRKIVPVRFILDANYSTNVKTAINTLVTEIRDDIIYYADLGFTSSPENALSAKAEVANFSSNRIAIYAQDFTVYDEYTGRDIKVTTPYFLAKKIPYCSANYGLQYPIAGNKRGVIDAFKSISWTPNETYKELLYNSKINYVEKDTKRTKFGSQLTSEARTTPLSNINNVITVLDIKIDVEDMAEDYIFEFNNDDTINTFQRELNDYLATYINKKAVERISATVYASDYDKLQKILRVSVEIKFYDIIERIVINLDVVKK
jgi:hypothetical protein